MQCLGNTFPPLKPARGSSAERALGFPVVDLKVTLTDGQFHSVDSPDMAWTAARMALQEALPNAQPVLLEPIHEVVVTAPNEATSKVHGILSGRRGQILASMRRSIGRVGTLSPPTCQRPKSTG